MGSACALDEEAARFGSTVEQLKGVAILLPRAVGAGGGGRPSAEESLNSSHLLAISHFGGLAGNAGAPSSAPWCSTAAASGTGSEGEGDPCRSIGSSPCGGSKSRASDLSSELSSSFVSKPVAPSRSSTLSASFPTASSSSGSDAARPPPSKAGPPRIIFVAGASGSSPQLSQPDNRMARPHHPDEERPSSSMEKITRNTNARATTPYPISIHTCKSPY